MLLRIESSQNSSYMQSFFLPHQPPKARILSGIIYLGPVCSASGPDPDFISLLGHLAWNQAFKLKDTGGNNPSCLSIEHSENLWRCTYYC